MGGGAGKLCLGIGVGRGAGYMIEEGYGLDGDIGFRSMGQQRSLKRSQAYTEWSWQLCVSGFIGMAKIVICVAGRNAA